MIQRVCIRPFIAQMQTAMLSVGVGVWAIMQESMSPARSFPKAGVTRLSRRCVTPLLEFLPFLSMHFSVRISPISQFAILPIFSLHFLFFSFYISSISQSAVLPFFSLHYSNFSVCISSIPRFVLSFRSLYFCFSVYGSSIFQPAPLQFLSIQFFHFSVCTFVSQSALLPFFSLYFIQVNIFPMASTHYWWRIIRTQWHTNT